MLQVIKESLCLLLALMTAVYTWKHLNLFYRIIMYQLILYAFTYAASYAVTWYQHAHHMELNNQWLYNLYFPLECALLAWAGAVYFQPRKARLGIVAGYIAFVTVYAYQLAVTGFRGFANYAVVAEALFMVVLYLLVLYDHFKHASFSWNTPPGLWLCLGISLYFGCIVPYFSMINYLGRYNPALNEFLFYMINDGLGNVRYLFTAIAFWLFYKQSFVHAKKSA